MLIDSRDFRFLLGAFFLSALQFVICIVWRGPRGYLDWNYSFVHRRSPPPRRELPQEPVPVPTSDLRAGARRLQPAASIRWTGIYWYIPACTVLSDTELSLKSVSGYDTIQGSTRKYPKVQ